MTKKNTRRKEHDHELERVLAKIRGWDKQDATRLKLSLLELEDITGRHALDVIERHFIPSAPAPRGVNLRDAVAFDFNGGVLTFVNGKFEKRSVEAAASVSTLPKKRLRSEMKHFSMRLGDAGDAALEAAMKDMSEWKKGPFAERIVLEWLRARGYLK